MPPRTAQDSELWPWTWTRGIRGSWIACLLLGCAGNQPPAQRAAAVALVVERAPAPATPTGPSPEQALSELQRRLAARFPALGTASVAPDCGMHLTDVIDADVDARETFAVSVSEDKTARVWSLENGAPIRVLRLPGEGQSGELFAVAVAPDGTAVAMGGWDGGVYVFATRDWRLQHAIPPARGTIDSIRYSRDGKRLAVGHSRQGGLSIFETENYTPIFEDSSYAADIYGLAFGEKGELAVSSWDRTVRLYSSHHGLLAKAEFETRPHRVAFDPLGKKLLVGFLDSPTVRLLDVPRLKVAKEFALPEDFAGSTLGTVGWARDGSQFFASGRYKQGKKNPILRWSRAGVRLDDWFLHENTPERLLGLRAGGLLLASQDPLIGVLNASGEVKWAHTAETPDFSGQARTLRASSDAASVEFAWGRDTPRRLTFDLRGLRASEAGASMPLTSASPGRPGLQLSNWQNATDPALNGRRLAKDKFEICRAASVDAAGKHILLGCEWNVYMYDESGALLWHVGTGPSARAEYLSDDARVAVVAFDDGTLRWLSGDSGQELAAALFYRHDEWVAWTPEGFFAGTKLGESLIGLHVLAKDGAAEFVPLLDFADLMRRPDLVAAAIDRAPIPGAKGAHSREPI